MALGFRVVFDAESGTEISFVSDENSPKNWEVIGQCELSESQQEISVWNEYQWWSSCLNSPRTFRKAQRHMISEDEDAAPLFSERRHVKAQAVKSLIGLLNGLFSQFEIPRLQGWAHTVHFMKSWRGRSWAEVHKTQHLPLRHTWYALQNGYIWCLSIKH